MSNFNRINQFKDGMGKPLQCTAYQLIWYDKYWDINFFLKYCKIATRQNCNRTTIVPLIMLNTCYNNCVKTRRVRARPSPYTNFCTVWQNEKCTLSPIWRKMKCRTDESGISFESNIELNILEISKTNWISNANIQWLQILLESWRLNGIGMSCWDAASSRGHNALIFLFTFWPNHENNVLQPPNICSHILYTYTHTSLQIN